MGNNAYQSNGIHKWYLKCHFIFVCKYRKRLLEGTMQGTIKEIFSVVELRSDFSIDIMETDKDHIHIPTQHLGYVNCTTAQTRKHP